jgi:WD40 repeat protein
VLHRELEGFEGEPVMGLATFLSADGQQPRLVAKAGSGQLRVYDPEAGSVLHRLEGHTNRIADLACIASSSAAPHHPRLVSASDDGIAKVWDGETGEMLADLGSTTKDTCSQWSCGRSTWGGTTASPWQTLVAGPGCGMARPSRSSTTSAARGTSEVCWPSSRRRGHTACW